MKKIFFPILLLFVVHTFLNAQSDRQSRRAFNANLEQLQQDTFDILPFPGEFPQNIEGAKTKRDGTRVTAIPTSWGSDLQKISTLKERIAAECKTKVHFRVIDTGENTHPDLARGKTSGTNYTSDPSVIDGNGHSTHCTGIIYSLCYPLFENGICTYENDKVLGNSGGGQFDWVANCETQKRQADQARAQNKVRTVVSVSLGGGTAIVSSVENALKANTFAVYAVAAGNTGGPGIQYPGKSAYVAGIASLDQSLTWSSYSSYGPECFMAAPGRNINSTWLNGGYATLSGTSMATPHAAALFGIALSKWGDLLPNQEAVETYFRAIAADLPPTGFDEKTGWGYSLITKILDTRPGSVAPPPPPPPTPIDTIPVREQLTLTYTFTGQKWPMWWSADVPKQSAEVAAAMRKDVLPKRLRVSKSMQEAAAMNLLTVTDIELEIITTTSATVEADRVKAALDKYFTNRGLGLFVGNDFGDATFWSSYFAELVLWQSHPNLNIRVLRIIGKDEKGRAVTWTDGRLKHLPK